VAASLFHMDQAPSTVSFNHPISISAYVNVE